MWLLMVALFSTTGNYFIVTEKFTSQQDCIESGNYILKNLGIQPCDKDRLSGYGCGAATCKRINK